MTSAFPSSRWFRLGFIAFTPTYALQVGHLGAFHPKFQGKSDLVHGLFLRLFLRDFTRGD
jgi:hypothetical protein